MLMVMHAGENGHPADDVHITWEVLSEEVGEITDSGSFKVGTNPGVYKEAIRVIVSQKMGDETVIIDDTADLIITGTVEYAEIHPSHTSVTTGQVIHFSTKGWDENSVLLHNFIVKWSVTNPLAGTIDALGNFRAGETPGVYTDAIRAEIVQQIPNLD